MKKGDYVRTKFGIAKYIERKFDIYGDCHYILDSYITTYIDAPANDIAKRDIIRTNSNILYLLEPMDLLYIDISPDEYGGIVVPRIPETLNELAKYIEGIELGKYILRGVVTHEQLENDVYKVVE